jgi:predicted XRE-type DNA-binding protein
MIPPKRIALFRAIKQGCFSQREVAHLTGIREPRLSGLVNGWQDPKLSEILKLGQVLGQPIAQIFPELKSDFQEGQHEKAL